MNIIFRYCFICLFLLIAVSCKNDAKYKEVISEKAYVSLTFKNLTNFNDSLIFDKRKFSVINAPYISYRSKKDLTHKIVDFDTANDNKSIKILEDSIYLKLRYSFDKFETFLLYIGDSVSINYVKGLPRLKVFNRKHKKFDYKMIDFFNDIQKPLNNFSFLIKNGRFRNKNEKSQYEESIKNYNITIKHRLDSIKEIELISEDVYSYKIKEHYYSVKKDNGEIEEIITNSSDIHIETYRELLLKYVNERIKPSSIKHSSGYILNSKKAFDFVVKDKLLNRESKDYLLWFYLKRIGNDFTFNEFKNRFNTFIKLTENQKLIEDLKSEHFFNYSDLKLVTDDVLLIRKDGSKLTLNKILTDNYGKIVYIDFWASWCAPCRRAMPDSRKIIKEYKNQDITFVYISIDKKLSDWNKALEQENLKDYRQNYIAINYPIADFFKELNLISIPRYLIFDKKGILISKNAPSPDSENIRHVLNQYILEK